MLSQSAVALFLDPGLGKTSTVLATIKILKAKKLINKVLIVAPLRPMYKVWPDEIEKWDEFSELTYTILHDKHKDANLNENADIYLINPEGLQWLFTPGPRSLPAFDVLVIDESSMFKDSQTKRFKSLKPWLTQFKRRWILTGTPVPNGLMDLFGQIYILDLGRALGRFITHYRNTFFVPSGYGGYTWTQKPDAFPQIIERISPLALQLSAEDYLTMPEIVNVNITVELPPQARKIYNEIDKEFISGRIVAGSAAVAGVKLRQVANGAVYDDTGEWINVHDEKITVLQDILEELGGSPALVLYEFNHDKDKIKRALGGDSVPVLGSGLSPSRLKSMVDRFNAGDTAVLLGHPASMGHGLNLQGACSHVIWFGIPWNLEHYDQAIARIYRQGQKSKSVFVYHIIAKQTKDEEVTRVLQLKDRDQQTLLKAINAYRQEHIERA